MRSSLKTTIKMAETKLVLPIEWYTRMDNKLPASGCVQLLYEKYMRMWYKIIYVCINQKE